MNRVLQSGRYILRLKVRQLLDDFFRGQPRCQEIQDVNHTNSVATYARSSCTLVRLNRDARKPIHQPSVAIPTWNNAPG